MTREWARWMYEADMAYQVYAALRDSAYAPLPLPSDNWTWGTDYP